MRKRLLQVGVWALAGAATAAPVVVVVLSPTAGLSAVGTTVRLTALIAYSLIFINILTGTLARHLYRIFSAKRVISVHRFTGIAGFLLALVHGVLTIAYNYLVGYSAVWILGPVTLGLLALTIAVALHRKRLVRLWRNIHRLNYLVFLLIYVKAMSIGSDLVSSSGSAIAMKVIFSVYLGVALGATLIKASELWNKRRGSSRKDEAPAE